MKQILSFDKKAKQFRCDVGTPQRRFYLGGDVQTAQQRKTSIVNFWRNCAVQEWTDEYIEMARAIAKGKPINFRKPCTTDQEAYEIRFQADELLKDTNARAIHTITTGDITRNLAERVRELEATIRERFGDGAVAGPKVLIHDAMTAFHDYRLKIEIDADTGKPKENVLREGDRLKFLKRLIPKTLTLTAFDYLEIQKVCKVIEARPLTAKGTKIRRNTVKNLLKTLRLFIRWASRNYGWQKPNDWHEATLVNVRRTKEERIEALKKLEQHFTVEEIRILYSYANPFERLLILAGLNFGCARAELVELKGTDLARNSIPAIRTKTESLGSWPVWPETQNVADQLENVTTRQGIANRWNRLLDRVQKDHKNFKRLSYKWLRKTGSSFIRKTAGGEIASLYISHGKTAATDDELLDNYARMDWLRVGEAVNTLRNQLDLGSPTTIKTGHYGSAKIAEVQVAWNAGLTWKEIVAKCGVSRDYVYKHRPLKEPL